MPFPQRLKNEFKAVAFTTAFFALWIGPLFVIKALLLSEYQPTGYSVGAAVFGVLLLAKVVVVLERVPLGRPDVDRPAWIDVLLRTALYAVGVFGVLVIERGLSGMSENGGFWSAVKTDLRESGAHHIAANFIAITAGLLAFNALCVVRRNLGHGTLTKMFLSPTPKAVHA